MSVPSASDFQKMPKRAPDTSTAKGKRNRAILTLLIGCGLRREELVRLAFEHVQQRDGRWCVVDIQGKHGRVRTVPMPSWAKAVVDDWRSVAAQLDTGLVFRGVNKGDNVTGERLRARVSGDAWKGTPKALA